MLAVAFTILSIGIAFLTSLALSFYLSKKKDGTKAMKEISRAIQRGAITFLNKQYRALVVFVAIFSIILLLAFSWKSTLSFILGSLFSALAGNLGMRIATKANAKTAFACSKSKEKGLKLAFFSGCVMSFLVCGLSLFGLTVLFYLFKDQSVLFSFGFGASSIALFARVAGGIYTKSADIGADLVGKIEKKLPEDSKKNPAVIADQVGDNVGDVAGMGADLFESYSDSLIAAVCIGIASSAFTKSIFPFVIAGSGILSSFISMFFVKGKNAFEKATLISVILMLAFTFFFTKIFWKKLNMFYCILSGLLAGTAIGISALFYTSYSFEPTKETARETKRGVALTLLSGFEKGMISTIVPIVSVVIATIVSYHFGSLYGIALSAVGMLSTLPLTLAIDCYGPVVDNAAGIAEMARLGKKVRKRASELDAIGNTTAAIGKGFAIGSAALTALALFAVYSEKVKLKLISLTDPFVVAGLFIGALIPFVFSSLTVRAVRKTTEKVVDETRRQFKELISKGKKPLYERCVGIVTNQALKKMILPTLIAIIIPFVVGFTLGKAALAGFLAGSISTGFLLAIFMANTGGSLDNAKKYIEDVENKKGTLQHEASVIGDTFGDPLKDCAGPSLNILLKLMAIIALVFFPLF